MRILCYILVVLFVTTTAVGQQINPVPDYIFRNSMSVGRNAPTDTSAYFSIGPRFGATRGFMPPMVVDTAAVTGTKRNGLLIYSIQRNSFLYWDSTGSRWSRIAANLDTLQLATRAWRQKGDDSLAARITSATDTLLLSTRAWRQKGIDSVASVRIGGSGTTNRVAKFTASGTIGNGSIFDSATTTQVITISPNNRVSIGTNDNGFLLDVGGAVRAQGVLRSEVSTYLNVTSGVTVIGSTSENGTLKLQVPSSDILIHNLRLGRGGGSISSNTVFGLVSGGSITTGNNNTFIGNSTGFPTTTGSNNTGIGSVALNLVVSGNSNTAVGQNSLPNALLSNNTAIGATSARFTNDGSTVADSVQNSIYIGQDTRAGSKTASNEIVIGQGGRGLGSNSVVLGNSSITNTYLRGKTLVNTTTDAGYQFDVAGSMRNTTDAYFNTSSGETYIGTTSDAGAFRLQVNGVAYAVDGFRTGNPTGGTAATWKLGTVASVSPTSPNRTIEVDIGGTIYYIHAKTTND